MEKWIEAQLDETLRLDLIVRAIKNGELLIVPFQATHIFLADAFSHLAVNKINLIREAQEGTSLGVLVSSLGMLQGIARSLSPEMKALGEKFWPGPLTALVSPNPMLNWNLGDDGELGYFAVRIPESELLLSIIEKTGPVVYANANLTGGEAITDLTALKIDTSEVAYAVQGEKLERIEIKSTVIKENLAVPQNIELIREGALSQKEIEEFLSIL